ncbi:MAG: hypothetical protein NTY48_03505 [Candidatus Diapherotrites archaeon]|nr:hypothetical protein [Candidatus Diapherotrites archaeon]
MVFVKIEKATEEDALWLDGVIRKEFPYTKFNKQKIAERINNENFIVLIARQENIITGFAEIELFIENNDLLKWNYSTTKKKRE